MGEFKARNGRRIGRTLMALVFVVGVALSSLKGASARDLDLRISQYHHTRWTKADGAPEMIVAIDQGSDGFLWLGSRDGLFRFDGVTFERISAEADDLGPVAAVEIASNGDVWAWFLGPRPFAVYRHGQLTFLPEPPVEGQVIQLLASPDGALWAGVGNPGRPLYRYRNDRWEEIDAAANLPRSAFINMLIAPDNALWVAYADYTLRLPPGSARFERVPGISTTMGRVALDPMGRVWQVDQGSARPVSGPGGRLTARLPEERRPAYDGGRPGSPIFDADGDLWEATRLEGVTRVASTPGALLDRFRQDNGLTSNAAWKIFRDREGNLWVGTSRGLDRFRRAAVVMEPDLSRPAPFGNSLLSASDGTVYIAEAETVYRARRGDHPQVWLRGTGEPQFMCEALDGSIWILSADLIRHVSPNGTVERIPRPPEAEGVLLGCLVDRDGSLVVSSGNGLFRRFGGQWRTERRIDGRPMDIRAIVQDADGLIWTASEASPLIRSTPQGWREVPPVEVLQTERIRGLLSTPEGLLISGRSGIAVYGRDGRMRGPVRPLRTASGLVRTADGDVWAFTPRGLIRMPAADFNRALREPNYVPAFRTFGASDGLGQQDANQLWRSLVQGGDGRIWLSMATGTAWIDPQEIPRNRLPPPVKITRVEAEGAEVRDPTLARLPAGTSELVISYAVLALSMPERQRVRYRLEGVDHDWVEPGERRQAFYTNLAPGRYRFQVIAANEDGVWNEDGAALEITIAPTFVQSIWFKFLVVLALLALIWGAYMLRMRQVTATLRERFQVRIAERERIARELHDTLLQGLQGIVLRVQSAASQLPKDGAVRTSLEDTLDRTDGLVVEGRARLRDLRRGSADLDLGRAIADAAAETIGGGPEFQLTVEGDQIHLDPVVADELVRTAEEALRNAVLHGEARRIEAIVVFDRRELRLAVRDDGKGMAHDLLVKGERDGHFGLVGMRERTERIGGRFAIASREGEGTEVSVTVPASRAYRDGHGFDLRRWFRRLRGKEDL